MKEWDRLKATATELQTIILDKFSEEKLFAGFCDHFYNEKEQQELQEEIDSLLDDLI